MENIIGTCELQAGCMLPGDRIDLLPPRVWSVSMALIGISVMSLEGQRTEGEEPIIIPQCHLLSSTVPTANIEVLICVSFDQKTVQIHNKTDKQILTKNVTKWVMVYSKICVVLGKKGKVIDSHRSEVKFKDNKVRSIKKRRIKEIYKSCKDVKCTESLDYLYYCFLWIF